MAADQRPPTSPALRYLEQLEPLMQAQPPKVAEIKALLEEARQAGYEPARLYLSALKLQIGRAHV